MNGMDVYGINIFGVDMKSVLIACGLLSIFFTVLGVGIAAYIGMRKKGGKTMAGKIAKQQIEEIQEEDVEEQPKQSSFCTVMCDNGKAYRGDFTGENQQFFHIRTEKVPLIAINKMKVVYIAFQQAPQAQQPVQKPKPNPQQEDDGDIEEIDV